MLEPAQASQDPRGWLRRLWGYLLRHRRSLTISLVAALLGSGCQVVAPLVARRIVDDVIITSSAPLLPWLLALIALAAATFGFAYFRRYHGGQVALGVQNDLRTDMHDHLQSMDLAGLDRMPAGQLVSRANSDSALVQGLLSMLPIMSGNVIQLVLSLVVMLFLSPLLAVVSFVMAPVLIAISYRLRTTIFPATWDAQQREGEVAQIVDEDIGGVRVVKAFGREQREVQRIADASVAVYGSQMRAVRLQARYQPLLQAVPTLGQVAILALGGWLALEQRITIGTFLAFSTYLAQLQAPARQLAGLLAIAQQARVGIERIFQLLDRSPAIADPPHPVEIGPLGEIAFENVRFGYGSPRPALDGFDLRIAPGERVALVGPSGSGKSTAAMLIPRFYDPSDGTVRVNGPDVREVSLASLRARIGMVFEESFLFSESVRDNIAYGRPEATEEEIRAAARVAAADEFIEALPRGYDTVVGERGLSLSGGQRQRVALARAVLADPQILILDDATSAVDATTEQTIHHHLRSELGSRTVLLIAHRESTLHLADRVVLMQSGRVSDQGTHADLISRNAVYRALVQGLEAPDDATRLELAGGSIEALITATNPVRAGVAEPGSGASVVVPPAALAPAVGAPAGRRAAGLGSGLGRSSGSSGIVQSLAATPELLAQVDALPPVRDVPVLDLAAETRPDPHFRLVALLREFRRPLMFGLVFVVLDALASVLGPYLVRTGIDSGVQAGSRTVLFTVAGLFLLLTLADLLDEVAETFVTGRVAQRVMLSLRLRIFAQLQRLSLDYYEREMAGRIMTRMTTDVDQFESLIQNGLLSAVVSTLTFVGVGVALLVVDWELGLATLTVVIPLALATAVFRTRAAVLYDQARERIAVVNADFSESLSGVRESQAFGHEALTRARFHALSGHYLEARVAAQRLVAVYFPFVQFLSGLADAIVLGLGAYLIPRGHLTAGALIAFILYIDLFFSPIQQLSQVFDSWQQTRVSVARIAGLMTLQTLTPSSGSPTPIGRLTGELALQQVRFAYPIPPDRPGTGGADEPRGPSDPRSVIAADAALTRPPEALRGITLAVPAGRTLALVGETGAGKSTVMKLIARFYDPDTGSVRADGHDLRDLALGDFRGQLGYVPQESYLFSGTVRDNIRYGRPGAGAEEVEAAARAVGAHDMIIALPGGYEHELAERGRSLSAGHRQLIALARAELVDPAILLLDEATSNLDLVTEARVSAAMRNVARGRTTVVIAHRLQTARAADRIAVLHDGRVTQLGSHEELLAEAGRYRTMWEAFEAAPSS